MVAGAAEAVAAAAAGSSGILHSLHSTHSHPEQQEQHTHSSRNRLCTHNILHSIDSDLAEAGKNKTMATSIVRSNANTAYKLNVSVQST